MFRRSVVAAALLGATLACSEPPTKERQQAEGALAAARAAGAAAYAPAELASAQAALETYDAAVADRDYRTALRLAIEARDGAYLAARQAADQKAAVRSRAEHLVSRLEAAEASASARLSGQASARPTGPAAVQLRASVKRATAAVQEARASMQAQDYLAVVASIEPIVTALEKELTASAPAAGRRGR